MTDLTFYTNPMSRGRIARWMLEEVGTPYETRYLNYGEDMQSSDYKNVNPMAKVPAIVHGGRVVTEANAICAYLADAFPVANLAPPLNERDQYYRWIFFAAGPVEAVIGNTSMGFELTEEQKSMSGYGDLERVLSVLKIAVSRAPYVCGENFTAADVSLGSQIGFGLQFGILPSDPVLEEYRDRIYNRPAHIRAQEIDDAALAQNSDNS